jgi:predicted nucleic acid-binding protein
MKVIVDISIWSLALRRKQEDLNDCEQKIVYELIELINEARVIMIGPIRQEILSGINTHNQLNQLKSKLKAFSDFPICTEDYEKAAEFFNLCRNDGIQGSHIDFLICSVAFNNNFSIFTTDKDFINYSKCTDINLYQVRNIAVREKEVE